MKKYNVATVNKQVCKRKREKIEITCVNMAKRGLIGEKIPLFFVESPDVQLPGAGRFVNIN